MRTITAVQLFFVLLLLSTGGCTSVYDARDARGSGIPRVYDASFDTVWDATPKAMSRLGLDVLEENDQERYILAVKGATALSFGENVAVCVYQEGDERARVEVVSKKRVEINLLARDWGEPILEELSQVIGSR